MSPSFTSLTPPRNPKQTPTRPTQTDRVALVAAPPSYTRMYHYYPAQLTHPYCYYSPPPLPPPPPPPQHAIGPGASPLPPSALAAGIGGGLGVGHARYPGAAAAFIRIYDDKTLGAGGAVNSEYYIILFFLNNPIRSNLHHSHNILQTPHPT